jgi:hypothetical protein
MQAKIWRHRKDFSMEPEVPDLIIKIRAKWGLTDTQIGLLIDESQQIVGRWRRRKNSDYREKPRLRLEHVLAGRIPPDCEPLKVVMFLNSFKGKRKKLSEKKQKAYEVFRSAHRPGPKGIDDTMHKER